MDYLTKFYKNKADQLQEEVNYLINLLNEDNRGGIGGWSDADIENWIDETNKAMGDTMSPEHKNTLREKIKKARARSGGGSPPPQSSAPSSAPSSSSNSFGQKAKEFGKGVGRTVGALGIAIPTMIGTDQLLQSAGIENEVVRGAVSTGAGLGAGEAAVQGVKGGLQKIGTKAALSGAAKAGAQGAGVGFVAGGMYPIAHAGAEKAGIKNEVAKDVAASAASVAAAEGLVSGALSAAGKLPVSAILPRVAMSTGIWGVGVPLAVNYLLGNFEKSWKEAGGAPGMASGVVPSQQKVGTALKSADQRAKELGMDEDIPQERRKLKEIDPDLYNELEALRKRKR